MAKVDLDKLSRKERTEAVKQLRKDQKEKEKKTTLFFTVVFVIALVLAGIGIYALSTIKPKASTQALGEFVAPPAAPNERAHIQQGEKHVPYTSNPPTSGPHYSGPGIGPIACKVYDKEVADESAVHNLEHGSVWVTYKDPNDKQLAKDLADAVSNFTKVILSPRPADDSKIAVVAWERIMKLDKFDKQKIQDFIKLYRDSEVAPERFGVCPSS